jgi:hypothetical protein
MWVLFRISRGDPPELLSHQGSSAGYSELTASLVPSKDCHSLRLSISCPSSVPRHEYFNANAPIKVLPRSVKCDQDGIPHELDKLSKFEIEAEPFRYVGLSFWCHLSWPAHWAWLQSGNDGKRRKLVQCSRWIFPPIIVCDALASSLQLIWCWLLIAIAKLLW